MSEPNQGEQDLKSFKMIFDSHLGNNPSLINSSKNQDIVMFLGFTGSGKSSLLNFLSGIPLVVDEYSELTLEEISYPGAFSIGKSDSETIFPQFVSLNQSLYYDMPGFEDSRGGCIDLVNACFIKNIIEAASSVKIVFVVGQDEITAGRGKKFLKSYEDYKRLIENTRSIENSSLLIISKSNSKNKSELVKYLSAKVKPSDLEGFRKWIDKEGLLPFSNKLETDEKLSIFQAIAYLEPITKAKVDIRPIFASDVKHQVKLMIENEFAEFCKECNLDLMNLQNSFEEIEDQIKYYSSRFKCRIDELIASSQLLKVLESLSLELVSYEYYAFEGTIQKIKYKSLQKLKLLRATKHNEAYIVQENRLKQELENKIEYLEKRCSSLEADNNIKELSIKRLESKNELIEKYYKKKIRQIYVISLQYRMRIINCFIRLKKNLI